MMHGMPADGLQPRHGRALLFNPEELASATTSEQVDRLGVGGYQIFVLVGVGLVALSESVEIGGSAAEHTALFRAFNLGEAERAALPLFTVAGSALALLLAGPVCDRLGRKAVLITSLVAMVVCMAWTASLPTTCGANLVLSLRFFAGFASSLGVPAGLVLAVESSPHSMRAQMLFAIAFVGSLGYFLCALGLEYYMPYLGESEDDRWRAFFMFTAVPSIVSLPIVMFLCESPCFLAVNRRPQECVEVLCQIAKWNGKRVDPARVRLPVPPEVTANDMREFRGKFAKIIAFNACLLLLLSLVDFGRSYFVSASAYLWKDFYAMASEHVGFTPATLNIAASLSPLLGLIIGERLLFVGVRSMVFICSVIACGGLLLLTAGRTATSPWYILGIVLVIKMTYGPISTCVSLMKTESFPTEVRATAFAFISFMGKIASALGPTVLEELKGDKDTWFDNRLNNFLYSLATSAILTGVLAVAVPGQTGKQGALEDFIFGSQTDDDLVPLSNSSCQAPGYGSSGPKDFGVPMYRRTPSEGSLWDIWGTPRHRQMDDDAVSVADSVCSTSTSLASSLDTARQSDGRSSSSC